MRRNVKNEKVLRAITIGLATVLSVTSTPMTAFAAVGDEGQTSGSESTGTTEATQSQSEQTPTVVSASLDAVNSEKLAENRAGNVSYATATTPATGTGEIGTKVADALNNVASGEAAVSAGNTLYDTAKTIGDTVAPVISDANISEIENLAQGQAEAFGVTFDENGNVTQMTDFNGKVEDVRNAVNKAETDKDTANKALNGVQAAVDDADGKIRTADTAKKTADQYTTNAVNARDDSETGADAILKNTQNELDKIGKTLNSAVDEDDINKAVAAVVTASDDAVKAAGANLTIVQDEFQKASDAADDAEKNSGSYGYQQMVNLASTAQTAADNAKDAADKADKAVEALEKQEEAAKKKLDDANTAMTTAKTNAKAVLQAYKDQLDKINAAITTANGYRKTAKDAMTEANAAIDLALKLLGEENDGNGDATNAQKQIKAMNEAIEAANKAIKGVSALMYDANASDEVKEANAFYNAEKKCDDAIKSLSEQSTTLSNAWNDYDGVITAKGTAAANSEAAHAAVEQIQALINGENSFDKWAADAANDINNIKALLSGSTVSYKQLQDNANGLAKELGTKEGSIKDIYDTLGGSEEDKKLTAEQIEAKFDKAVSDNSALDTTINGLSTQISANEKIIADCNSSEGTVKNESISAGAELTNDLSALDNKYVYSENEETGLYEIATDEDGNPVYTVAYKILVARSQATKSEYKCGDEVLAPTVTPNYTDAAGSKYVKAQTGTVTATSRPNLVLGKDNYRIAGGPGIDFSPVYDSEKGKFIQTIGYSYDKDMTVGEDIGKNNKKYSQTFDTKPEDALAEILPGHLSNVLNAQLTKADIKIDKEKYTVTIELDSDNASRLGKEQHEVYVLYYNMKGVKLKEDKKTGKWEWECNNINLTVKDGSSYYGRFTETTEFDAKKYDLTVSPTADALRAQSEKQTIDAAAETAKGVVNEHKRIKEEKAQAYEDLKNARADAAKALYGYDKNGTPENPAEGSLLDQKAKAEATRSANQTLIDALGTIMSSYKVVKLHKQAADQILKNADEFDITKAEGISDADKERYNNAVTARKNIIAAKSRANGYLTKLQEELADLDSHINCAIIKADGVDKVNGEVKYAEVGGQIEAANNRLAIVNKKLTTLKSLYQEAFGDLKPVDDKITVDGKVIDINDRNDNLKTKVNGYAKYEDYGEIALIKPFKTDDEISEEVLNNIESWSISSFSETLAAAINNEFEVIFNQNKALSELAGQKSEAVAMAKEIREIANKAQDAADRAATALKNWRAPGGSGGDDDDDDTTAGDIVSGTGLDMALITGGDLLINPITAGGRSGVAGVRTGDRTARGRDNVVDIQGGGVPLSDGSSVIADASGNGAGDNDATGKTATVTDNMVPLADKPFENDPLTLPIILAALTAAGAGVFGINRKRRSVKSKSDNKNN